jgi:hypothetical protein
VANIPVSIAPFKASDATTMESVGVNLIQDFVEGTMIHAYRTTEDTEVHLSTRTKLGAKTRFYSRRNFDELVRETPQWATLQTVVPSPSSCASPSPSDQFAYSFANLVLQHPEHRIVAAITTPRLYMISIGLVKSDGTVEIQENPELWSAPAAALAPDTIVAPPSTTINEAAAGALLSQQMAVRGWTWQGLVFKNTASLQRWRFRSPMYTPVRDMRGSESDSYTRFLRLRHNNQLHHYVAYFPEEQKEFYELESKLRDQTRELFRAYSEVHRGPKNERKNLKDIAWPLNNHVYTLHGLYISQLKPMGLALTIENTIQYVNALPVLKQRALLVTPVGGKVSSPKVEELTMTDHD